MADYDALKAEAAERNEEIRELKLEIERLKAEMGQEKQQKEQDLKVLMADKDKDLVCLNSLLYSLNSGISQTLNCVGSCIHSQTVDACKTTVTGICF